MSFQAAVRIEGELVGTDWDGSSVMALAGVEINWGRNDLYEDVPPSTFQASFIDPSGEFATDNSLSGKSLWIEDVDQGKVLLRGKIAEPRFTPITVLHPVTSELVDVWLVELIGKCKLADVQQANIVGPMAYQIGATLTATNPPYTDIGPWIRPPRDAGWWTLEHDDDRLATLMSQGLNQVISGIDTPSRVYTALGFPAEMLVRETPVSIVAERTAIQRILDIFHMYPLGHANYDSTTDHVQLAQPATTGGLELVLSGGLIVAQPVDGLSVPASDVQLPEGRQLRSTIAYAIDKVVVPWLIVDPAYNHIGASQQVASTERKVEGSVTDRQLVIETAFFEMFGGAATVNPDNHEAHAWAQRLADLVADLVDDVNGKFSMPRIRFDLRRWAYDPDLVDVILDSKDHPVPIYFPGSIFRHLPNVAVQYQVIGGRLRWEPRQTGSALPAGWVLDAIVAPATGTIDNVSMVDLVTNAGPAMEDFDPELTMGELGDVTIGLA